MAIIMGICIIVSFLIAITLIKETDKNNDSVNATLLEMGAGLLLLF
jgi:hypothetical protein